MTETQRNIAEYGLTENQVDMLQTSLLCSILYRGWGGLITKPDHQRGGGLIREGGLIERGGA